MLFYAEVEGAQTGKRADLTKMAELLTKVGCSELVYLDTPLALVLGDGTDLTEPPLL